MIYTTMRTSLDDGILLVTLDREDRMNAFTPEMADELEVIFRAVNDDDEVSAVVVTGAGKAFCAGMEFGAGGNVFGLAATASSELQEVWRSPSGGSALI